MIEAAQKPTIFHSTNWSMVYARSAMGMLIALQIAAFSMVSIRIYQTYNAAGDLTVYEQTFWNSITGHPFQTTYNWSVHAFWSLVGNNEFLRIPNNASGVGVHFEPAMMLFWPVFWLWPRPETLLTLQSAVLGSAAWPVFALARRKLNSEVAGLVAGIAFLLCPALAGTGLVDFHAQAFLVLWIGLTFYFLEEEKDVWFAACYVCALFTNEIASVTLAMIGLYALVIKKRRRLGIAASLVPLAYFWVVTDVVIPHFSLYGHYIFTGYFSHWGGSPLGLIRAFMASPGTVVAFLTGSQQINYLLALFVPVVFLPLVGLDVLLVASPVLLANLLADNPSQRLMWGHYSASILPLLYYAAIWGAARLRNIVENRWSWPSRVSSRWAPARVALVAAVIPLLLFFNAQFSLWPVTSKLKWDNYQSPMNMGALQRAMALIPDGASVSTVDSISTHVANRRELYLFPVYADRVDYIILPRTGKIWPLTQQQQDKYLAELIGQGNDRVIFDEGGYLVLRRASPEEVGN